MSESGQSKGGFDGPLGLAAIVLAIVVGAVLLERFTRPTDLGGSTPPMPLPELRAEGWLNTGGAGLVRADLSGQWVVVDSWATFCRPCLMSMPKLADLYGRWKDRGVEIVGVTSEPGSMLDTIEATVNRFEGVDWPVAYGAGMVNDQLSITMIPTYILFDPEGISVWRGHSVKELEAALEARL
ncbi:Thiol-disulfide oxidoreductase ResA [Planctomycetes bacterium MalM25]|nr:Thiol-disulfide oxidoreductase ResA [Planctomycetes bacterium MalM25]